ncbi:flagellar basal body-associated FliL family protein [Profundibacterium mesophilum]|uniref:Flagellar basal body-associated protein FliL n=1 Tax=Profundibacterium mesophilum KAUST100406-0324 TaxID=1037889 RepID=A0A921NT56_9RHOB|nr:flagellar basal body-associated FliL family protein [Profundibacterium mesophilum]KAF0674651.1 hypothetical protein PMES_03033 [Profundibacterium mesophilum KAUST100406-0324]
MKLSLILFAAVPLLSLGGGYGAGLMLAPDASQAKAAVDPEAVDTPLPETETQTAAEAHLAEAADMQAQGTSDEASPDAAGAADTEAVKVAEAAPQPKVVKLGRMTVPVYKPRSITYVVADFGISVPDEEKKAFYAVPENAARLRDAILTSLTEAASGTIMRGVAIDTDALSSALRDDLSTNFGGIDEVLFLAFYKKDVPRS